MVIGLAGNIGSGKSTAARFFSRWGCRRINADAIGRRILPEIERDLIKRWGDRITARNRLDRGKLRDLVFSDPRQLPVLNRLSHPRLIREIRRRLHRIKSGCVVVDAALLFTWPGLLSEIDYPILISAPRKIKEQRCCRRGIDARTFRQIIRQQPSESMMARQASFTIRNTGTLKNLRRQCAAVYKEIKNDC